MKSWDGTVRGSPPTGGGGGNGTLRNITVSSVILDQVQTAVQIVQNFNASTGDTPSFFEFGDITYKDWSGTLSNSTGELLLHA
jgi:galacturan 1,4-alpha-galacturonidase